MGKILSDHEEPLQLAGEQCVAAESGLAKGLAAVAFM